MVLAALLKDKFSRRMPTTRHCITAESKILYTRIGMFINIPSKQQHLIVSYLVVLDAVRFWRLEKLCGAPTGQMTSLPACHMPSIGLH